MRCFFWKFRFLNTPGSGDKTIECSQKPQKWTVLVESFSENQKLSKSVHGEKSYSSPKLEAFGKIPDVAGFSYSKSGILLQKLSQKVLQLLIFHAFSFERLPIKFGICYLHKKCSTEKFLLFRNFHFFIFFQVDFVKNIEFLKLHFKNSIFFTKLT